VAAGFDVVGVDINPQPRYPFPFWKRDAIDFLKRYGRLFAAVHASPPCQRWTKAQRIQKREHPDLIAPTREVLLELGLPYVIENVRGAVPKLRDPIMLCGAMFGLEMYRHRYFETDWPITEPMHPPHSAPQVKMGRSPKPGEFIQAVGNFSGVQKAREVMEMPWANRDGLREAIPPAYTEFIGVQLMEAIR
jgi:DNA (cytosine-5)-methyltransferase 1